MLRWNGVASFVQCRAMGHLLLVAQKKEKRSDLVAAGCVACACLTSRKLN